MIYQTFIINRKNNTKPNKNKITRRANTAKLFFRLGISPHQNPAAENNPAKATKPEPQTPRQ